MHRELHLTKRGSCGDRRNIIQFAHHHSRRAFVLLSPARRILFFLIFFISCADLSRSGGGRVEGTRASNHGEFSNNKKESRRVFAHGIFLFLRGWCSF